MKIRISVILILAIAVMLFGSGAITSISLSNISPFVWVAIILITLLVISKKK